MTISHNLKTILEKGLQSVHNDNNISLVEWHALDGILEKVFKEMPNSSRDKILSEFETRVQSGSLDGFKKAKVIEKISEIRGRSLPSSSSSSSAAGLNKHKRGSWAKKPNPPRHPPRPPGFGLGISEDDEPLRVARETGQPLIRSNPLQPKGFCASCLEGFMNVGKWIGNWLHRIFSCLVFWR